MVSPDAPALMISLSPAGTAEKFVQHDRDRGIHPVPLYVDLDVACIHGVLQQRKGVYARCLIDDDGVALCSVVPFRATRGRLARHGNPGPSTAKIASMIRRVDTLPEESIGHDDDRIIAAKQLNLTVARATRISTRSIVAVADHDRSFAEAAVSARAERFTIRYSRCPSRWTVRMPEAANVRKISRLPLQPSIDIRAFAAINFVWRGPPLMVSLPHRQTRCHLPAPARDCRGTAPSCWISHPAACVDIDRIRPLLEMMRRQAGSRFRRAANALCNIGARTLGNRRRQKRPIGDLIAKVARAVFLC